ncbi:unnamed protein product [Hermetia illucens]|uniref:CREG-like beta-barrel domain-containing protein n=1 Tax=Hermetia illucens TaxID=343691 RepID=A0A7R8YZW8_HERIL|nr:protein CREG1-like [Hermetia illucens]CAD7090408.1 unnamed protein product [Hermetia illucens]
MLIKVNLLLCGIFATVGSCFGQYANNTTSENRALAHIARKLVHAANWTVLGTIAPIPEIKGFPMVNLVPMSDGPPNGRSSGYIYFHLSKSNIVVESIQARNNVTALITPNDDLGCVKPGRTQTCYNAMISGCTILLRPRTNEFALGLRAYLSRHPKMAISLLEDDFLLYKLVVEKVFVVDSYGTPNLVPLQDYYTNN